MRRRTWQHPGLLGSYIGAALGALSGYLVGRQAFLVWAAGAWPWPYLPHQGPLLAKQHAFEAAGTLLGLLAGAALGWWLARPEGRPARRFLLCLALLAVLVPCGAVLLGWTPDSAEQFGRFAATSRSPLGHGEAAFVVRWGLKDNDYWIYVRRPGAFFWRVWRRYATDGPVRQVSARWSGDGLLLAVRGCERGAWPATIWIDAFDFGTHRSVASGSGSRARHAAIAAALRRHGGPGASALRATNAIEDRLTPLGERRFLGTLPYGRPGNTGSVRERKDG